MAVANANPNMSKVADERSTSRANSFGGAALEVMKKQSTTGSNVSIETSVTKIVDCNPSSFGSVAKTLAGKRKMKQRLRKYATDPAGSSLGAAQLVCDVGDTVISVAVSADDMCAPDRSCSPMRARSPHRRSDCMPVWPFAGCSPWARSTGRPSCTPH